MSSVFNFQDTIRFSMMVKFENYNLFFQHDTFMESFLKNKETDCVLYSIEGTKFNIHKEIIFQSKLLRNISLNLHDWCYQNIEIFCPCKEDELESVLNFLYNGTTDFDNERDVLKVLENLRTLFGFPEKLVFCEKSVTIM